MSRPESVALANRRMVFIIPLPYLLGIAMNTLVPDMLRIFGPISIALNTLDTLVLIAFTVVSFFVIKKASMMITLVFIVFSFIVYGLGHVVDYMIHYVFVPPWLYLPISLGELK